VRAALLSGCDQRVPQLEAALVSLTAQLAVTTTRAAELEPLRHTVDRLEGELVRAKLLGEPVPVVQASAPPRVQIPPESIFEGLQAALTGLDLWRLARREMQPG
jgi:hypothetical protein